MVSVTGSTGITASLPRRSSATTRANISGGVSTRAASCTSTNRASPAQRESGTHRIGAFGTSGDDEHPFRKRGPHQFGRRGRGKFRRHDDNHAVDLAGVEHRFDRSIEHGPAIQFDERLGQFFAQTNAAAGRRNDSDDRPVAIVHLLCSGFFTRLATQDAAARTSSSMLAAADVVRALGESELAHQDLTSLGQHSLLTCGKAAVLLPAPQVADNFRDLVDVAGGQLLEVGLVPPRPVGRLFGVRRTQHLKNLVETLLSNNVAHSDVLCVICRNSHCEVALRDFQNQIFLLLTLDGARFDSFDQRRTVVGVYDGVSDLENHVSRAPFDSPSLTRDYPVLSSTVQVRGIDT